MIETTPVEHLPAELDRAAQLVEWYWLDGRKRPWATDASSAAAADREKYRLPVDQWLAPLYNVRDTLRALSLARQPRRPALALWGLSQTGKSTALAFIDGRVTLTGVEDEDGTGGGLHWPGGSPFIYQPPLRNAAPDHWHGCAYNPFNLEDDGSSCLTRFVAAEPAGTAAGAHVVEDARHPVLVRLLRPGELLNTIARGYDTQCLGPEKAGRHTPWTAPALEETIDRIAHRHALRRSESREPTRAALEIVLRLIGTVEDLHAMGVETFAKLAEDGPALRQLLDRLLLQKECFIADVATAREVTAAILWGGADYVTAAYGRLSAWYDKLRREWGDRPIHATLATAMLLVDFGSGVNLLKGKTTAVRQRIQGALISKLGWQPDGDRILIGSGPDYPNRLGATPEEYAMTQALVWELVLPVNMANLPDSPGKRLLAEADILDFPGVGKDALNETSRINLNFAARSGGRPPEVTDFFGKILKRGKTAAVVASYARRRNIDAFAILQSLKTDTAPSAEMIGQILEGCETWARCAGYAIGPDDSSPLPLHFVLTFWGLKASQFRAGTEANFQNAIGKMIESYGWIRTRSTAWALNYHWLRTPDGEILAAVDLKRFMQGSPDYEALVREREFLEVYGNPVSRESFDQMLVDRETGGLDYFLRSIATQLGATDLSARQRYIDRLIAEQLAVLRSLCAFPYLRPPADEKDRRIDTMVAFRRRIIEAVAPQGEAQVRELSHALREFLNVDPEQLPYVPLDAEQLDATRIDLLFFGWREAQLRRYDAWKAGRAPAAPDWGLLRCGTREELGEVLQSLLECLGDKVCVSIADSASRWLHTLRPFPPDYQAHHLRRYIAAEMVNWLCFFFPDPEQPAARRRPRAERDQRWKLAWADDAEGLGPAMPGLGTMAWRQGVAPILDDHFAYVLGTKSQKPERPPLPGDAALADLLPALD